MTIKSNHTIWSTIIAFTLIMTLAACESDEVKPDPTSGLTKINSAHTAGIRVDLYATRALFVGYNRVAIFLYDSITGKPLSDVDVVLYPEMDMATMKHSCPVEQPSKVVNDVLEGAILFTMPSADMGTWTVAAELFDQTSQTSKGTAIMEVEVVPTKPSEIVSFQTAAGDRYYISYNFPRKMQVGVNRFIVVVYTFKDGEFLPAQDLAMELSPEMPSMDHGSPNNEHPEHEGGGHYEGKVNFTMTGEWRLHLKLRSGNATIAEKYFDVVVP